MHVTAVLAALVALVALVHGGTAKSCADVYGDGWTSFDAISQVNTPCQVQEPAVCMHFIQPYMDISGTIYGGFEFVNQAGSPLYLGQITATVSDV